MMNYFNFVKVLVEGRLFLSCVLITRYFECLGHNLKTSNDCKILVTKFSYLLEITKSVTATFSVLLLLVIAYNFVNLVVYVIVLYCNVRQNRKKIVNVMVVGGYLITVSKILGLILIPSECINKVGTVRLTFDLIDSTNSRLTKYRRQCLDLL